MDAGEFVTPVLLTMNEASNVQRTLERLMWAREVVIVDSGSVDETEAIARRFRNVRWHVRPFDSHQGQWEFALRNTSIRTPYALALDADMVLNDGFVTEMVEQVLVPKLCGGEVRFRMLIAGQPLWGDVYPAQVRLFRVDSVRITQRGHTQVFECGGAVYRFRNGIDHDDRKCCDVWLSAQVKYSSLELSRILEGRSTWKDGLRRTGLMPIVAWVVAYIVSGGPFRGKASTRYAGERALFELMLWLRLIRAGEGR